MIKSRAIVLLMLILGGVVAFPDAAVAEVMDKEPTLVVTWAWALVGGALGLVGWRFRWWLGAALALLPAAYFVGLHFELADPYVGPAIAAEAGRGYRLWSYGAVVVFVVMHMVGLWRALRGRSYAAS
jgi:hypothetical protein